MPVDDISSGAGKLHYLLTRFNIASAGREMPIRNTPGWLDRRFDLFEQYCLPSIAAQTYRDFRWLIYFDEQTPEEFRKRIERDQQVFPFEARFVGLFDVGLVQDDLEGITGGPQKTILTTRLDNDDAVSRDFLERVQAAAANRASGTVLNFPQGFSLRNGKAYTARDDSNPFTTLVEHDVSRPQTIWAAQHHELAGRWDITQVSAPPVWLQVVHGENVTNRVKGKRLQGSMVLAQFALREDVAIDPGGMLATLMDNWMVAPVRSLREGTWKLLKPILRPLLSR